ncbi:hypothetical protein [Streptomyces canus]|uniref:hypothetical protein n=1 Tax=Streptomyces canus TaxID=58343 RepID=UPI002DD80A54|nr:hypothetical protein [Streptomyces canus]WSD84420.1 hypothetical protein OG925_08980 [Streptomyces canus]
MATMKSVHAAKDKVATFLPHLGGMPSGADGAMRAIPLGHEPAGEIVEVGAEVRGLASQAHRTNRSRRSPGAAEKVVVTFDEASHL